MRIALTTLVAAALSAQSPATVSVLASGALEGAIVAMKGMLTPATFQFLTSQGIAERLAAGETPDVLVAQPAIIEGLVRRGRAVESTRTNLGRIGIGVAVTSTTRPPDIGSAPALKSAILDADAVIISRGASGTVLEKVFQDLGVASHIEGRLVRETRGDDVMKRIGESRGRAIGFTMISEIQYGTRHGGRYAGPLPATLQRYTLYEAVVLSGARAPDAARAFVRALSTPAARAILQDNGWEF